MRSSHIGTNPSASKKSIAGAEAQPGGLKAKPGDDGLIQVVQQVARPMVNE